MKTRLRHVARINPLSYKFDRLQGDDLVLFLPMESIWPGGRLDLSELRPKSSVTTGYTRFESGDVIVPKITPTFEASRSILIPDLPNSVGTGTTELHVVRPGPETDPRYILYIFHSHDFLKLGAAQMYGVAGQKRVPDDLIRDWEIDLPSLDEQRRIADFLDAETARIDQLVSLRSRQVSKLLEALQCEAERIISPEWVKTPLRRVVESTQTGATPTELLQPPDADNIPWYTPAALGGYLDLDDAGKSINKKDIDGLPRFPAESILIVGIGESLGKIALLDHRATGNQQLTAVKISPAADRGFVAWRLFAAYDEIRAWAQYSRVRIINNDVLKSFTIPLPPLDQQVATRREIDLRLDDFQDFRAASTHFSQLAMERRRALITAAVTGGITV